MINPNIVHAVDSYVVAKLNQSIRNAAKGKLETYVYYLREFSFKCWVVEIKYKGYPCVYLMPAKPTKRQVRKLVKQAKRSRYLFF